MATNNKEKNTRGVTLRQPKDIRRVVQQIVSKAVKEGKELEYSGRISQLMGVWLRSMEIEAEIEKAKEFEARLKAVEEREKGK
jgi:hypothetical protein